MGIHNRGKLGAAFVMLAGLACTAFGQVEEEWVRLFPDIESFEWIVGGIVADDQGNCYVSGSGSDSAAVVKYDQDGNVLWSYPIIRGYSLSAPVIGPDGYIYVTNRYQEFFILSKIDSDGNSLWQRWYDGPLGGIAYAHLSIGLDDSGNVYVSGSAYVDNSNYDMQTVKYDSEGNLIWARIFDGSLNIDYRVRGMAVDGAGNVYLSGSFRTLNSGIVVDTDTIILKYDTDGNELWTAYHRGTRPDGDRSNAIALGDDGNVYLRYILDVSPGGTDLDAVTVKYDSDGNLLWSSTYNGPFNGYDYTTDIVVDPDGNVFVSGATLAESTDMLLIKYDSNGNELWVRTYDGNVQDSDLARAMSVDGNGDVYILCTTHEADFSGHLYLTLKYSSEGDLLWKKSYPGEIPANSSTRPVDIALDSSGNVYIMGHVRVGQGVTMATLKYSQTPVVLPDSLSIVRGVQTGGGLGVLFASDDDRLTVRAGITLFFGEAPIQIEMTGTADTETPGELRFRLEAMANTPNLGQTIEMFNYVTSQYEEVDFWIAGPTDSIVEVVISTNPERFIKPGTREMKTKVSYKAVGITLLWPYSAMIDQAVWIVVP